MNWPAWNLYVPGLSDAYDYFDPAGESIRRQDDFLGDGEKKEYSELQISYWKKHYAGAWRDL